MKKRLFFISAAFILSLTIIFLLAYLLYGSYSSSNDYNYRIEHAYKISLQTSELENLLKEAETGHRGFLLTNDSAFLQPYFSIRKDIKPNYDSLKALTDTNATQNQLLNKAGLLINKLIDQTQQSIRPINAEKTRDDLMAGKAVMDSLRKVFKAVMDAEMKMVRENSANKLRNQNIMPRYFTAVAVFAFAVFMISFIVILKEFRQRSRYQKQLEQKVNETHAYTLELEQIAFATSHDLQEPLRRIRTFSDRLLWKYRDQLNEEGQMILSRLDHSARRMQGLIEDLMNFTNLVRGGEQISVVNGDQLMQRVLSTLKQEIDIKRGMVHVGQMPAIVGYEEQLYIMFKALVDNALKFSKTGVPPVVTIQWVKINGAELAHIDKKLVKNAYIRISIQDNGIGFSNEFSQKMFLIFQKLHSNSEYEGKGIGLAIVERVMTNHNGYVIAKGQLDKGALFNLYFPASEA